jgi:hypothetical protein
VNIFWIFSIFMGILTLSSTILSLMFSLRLSRKGRKKQKRENKGDLMQELREGGIKCHILPNDAPVFNTKKWIIAMHKFMRKPIYKQLMSLEGTDIDEGY